MDDLEKKPATDGAPAPAPTTAPAAAPAAETEDDTRTRKTVRLRPSMGTSMPSISPAARPVLTDPMGRDTDTGNLEVLDDTKTRKTVKLKPIAPHPVVNPAGKLAITPPTAPAPAPAPAAAENGDQTVKVHKVALPHPAAPAEKATVKLPTPRAAAPGSPAAPKITPPRPAVPPMGKPPVLPKAAPVAPKAPVAPQAAPVAPKAPAGKPLVPPEADLGVAPESEKTVVAKPKIVRKPLGDDELEFSTGDTIMRIISGLLVLAAMTFVVIQFIDLMYGTDIASAIPGLPIAK